MSQFFKILKSLRIFSKKTLELNESAQSARNSDTVRLKWNETQYSDKLIPPENTIDESLNKILDQRDFNQWPTFFNLDRDQLQEHPDRAALAILAGSALMQKGRDREARQLLWLAREWGGDPNLLKRVLISEVHSILGRAASIISDKPRAVRHASEAASMLISQKEVEKAMLLRYADASMAIQKASRLSFDKEEAATFSEKKINFSPELVAVHSFGNGWASNTVNTAIFRHHGVLTWGRQQYLAFFIDENTLRLVKRDLDTEEISTHQLYGKYNLADAHNSISLGIDRSGCLHISYDQHATKLNYRRALVPNSITHWTDEIPMTGQHEGNVTYPTFILPRNGYPLTMLYRDGSHDKGTAYMKSYDEAAQAWSDHFQPILSGADQKPWTSNAYWNHPAIGADGSIHLSFVWRSRPIGTEYLVNNKDVSYAVSTDNGVTWSTSQGKDYLLPITQVNAEVVYPVSPGSNLINQCSMAVDSKNQPHVVFYSNDHDGILQYQHVWLDGNKWRHQYISSRTHPFQLKGRGTLRIPISRPEIVMDKSDNAFIIYRGDLTENLMAATLLLAPHYIYCAENTKKLWDENLGFAEPVIDRQRWMSDGILSILLQNNEQPDEDKGHETLSSPVSLIDIRFSLSGIKE